MDNAIQVALFFLSIVSVVLVPIFILYTLQEIQSRALKNLASKYGLSHTKSQGLKRNIMSGMINSRNVMFYDYSTHVFDVPYFSPVLSFGFEIRRKQTTVVLDNQYCKIRSFLIGFPSIKKYKKL